MLVAGLVTVFGIGAPALPASADSSDQTLTVVVDRDVDGDGAYSADVDEPEPGIDITVTDASGASEQGVTDEHGEYVLEASDKLSGSRYFVVAEIPADLDLSPVPESDSFAPLSTTVDVGSEPQKVRMGVATRVAPTEEPSPEVSTPPEPPAPPPVVDTFAIGDLVWRDANRNGRQDAGEAGAPGISVQLLTPSGDVTASTVTNRVGHYVFDDLGAGSYVVRFAGLPVGYRFAAAGAGSDHTRDSDVDNSGATSPITLGVGAGGVRASTGADRVSAGYIDAGVDAGITALRYAIGDRVWFDQNHDGVQEAGEPGASATVTLIGSDNGVLASTSTDGQGHYLFSDLKSGRYRVQFGGLPLHRALTVVRGTGDPSADSDADPANGLSPWIHLKPGAPNLVPATDVAITSADVVNPTVNAGLVGSYSVGDLVFADANGNGIADAGERGVAGVRVDLLDAEGHVLARRVTSRTGHYAFTRLLGGTYRLKFSRVPAGKVFSGARRLNNPAVDSDADAVGLTPTFVLGEDSPSRTDLDAGLTTPAKFQAGATSGRVPIAAAPVAALPDTGGPSATVPLTGIVLVLAGVGCLVVERRRVRA